MAQDLDEDEQKEQEDLSWLRFCPVCAAELDANILPWLNRVRTKDCPNGHGTFSIDYSIVFSLVKEE